MVHRDRSRVAITDSDDASQKYRDASHKLLIAQGDYDIKQNFRVDLSFDPVKFLSRLAELATEPHLSIGLYVLAPVVASYRIRTRQTMVNTTVKNVDTPNATRTP